MRAPKLLAVVFSFYLLMGTGPAQAAAAADPCDTSPGGIMSQMSAEATTGFQNMDKIVESLMRLPQPTSSSNCLNDIFSVWALDPKAMAVEAIGSAFGPGMLAYQISGITLTGSNPLMAVVMSAIDMVFDNFIGQNICGELYQLVGEAMKPINYIVNSSGKLEMVVGAARGINMGSMPFSIKGWKGNISLNP